MTLLRLRSDAVEWREVEGEVLALEVGSATYIAANKSGAVLWERLASGATRDELVEALASAYDLDRAKAETDVDAFVETLRSRDLLVEDGDG